MWQTSTAVTSGYSPQPIAFNDVADAAGLYVCPPVGRVFFVRGNGTTVTNYDDQYTQFTSMPQRQLWPSVASVLNSGMVKANRGDIIRVLPGHTENLASADSWPFVAGVRIVCDGTGSAIPTFTFTTAASTILMNDANVTITGGRFLCAGPAGTTALTVAAPFAMSAVGCALIGGEYEVGIDADQICGTFLAVTAARCAFLGNRVESQAAAAAITDLITLNAANFFQMQSNKVKASVTTAATGLVRAVTGASTNIYIADNVLHNNLANSTGGLNFNAALACTGTFERNLLIIEETTSVAAITMNAAADIRLNQNYVQNEKNKTAIQIGTAVD